MLRIGLIQMKCEKGATRENLAVMANTIAEAEARRLDIIGFPEMCISGYTDPTRCPESVLSLDGAEVKQFLEMTRGCHATVLAGLIEENPAGGKPFITQMAARDGRLIGRYRKATIKNEEELWFSAGQEVPVFRHAGLTFGIAICADVSNEAVYAACARQGAQIMFELAAPGLHGKQSNRNWRSGFEWWQGECQAYLSRYAREYRVWIAVATQAGRTVDEDFPGGGYVFAPDGQCLFATPDWSPGAVFLQLDLEQDRIIHLS